MTFNNIALSHFLRENVIKMYVLYLLHLHFCIELELEDSNKQRTDHQTYDSDNVNIIIDVDCGVVVSSVCKYVTL